jgi:PTS system mannose-specific IIB component
MRHIELVRVDDRLIHGQVTIKWLRHLPCREILIVDDELCKDEWLQSVLSLAAPADVDVHVVPLREASQFLAGSDHENIGVLVLVRSPQTALGLLSNGVAYGELNVGGLAGGPAAVRLFKSVSVTDDQMAALLQLRDMGVRVFFQTVPEERPVELASVLRSA